MSDVFLTTRQVDALRLLTRVNTGIWLDGRTAPVLLRLRLVSTSGRGIRRKYSYRITDAGREALAAHNRSVAPRRAFQPGSELEP